MLLQKPMLGTQLDHSDSLNNPVLDLLFNEGHGDKVYDLSGYGNHGTLHGFAFPPTVASGWNPGTDGVGLNFDGSDDYISVPDSPSLKFTKAFMIDVVVKTNASTRQSIITKCLDGDNTLEYHLGINDSGIPYFEIYDVTWRMFNGVTAINDGDFHRITVVFLPANHYYIYKDGRLDNDGVTTFSISSTGGALHLGGWIPHPDRYLEGTIARVRILPRAMSAFEVMQRQINPYGVYLQ